MNINLVFIFCLLAFTTMLLYLVFKQKQIESFETSIPEVEIHTREGTGLVHILKAGESIDDIKQPDDKVDKVVVPKGLTLYVYTRRNFMTKKNGDTFPHKSIKGPIEVDESDRNNTFKQYQSVKVEKNEDYVEQDDVESESEPDISCEERQEYEDEGCTGSIPSNKCNYRYGKHDGINMKCKLVNGVCKIGSPCKDQPDIIVDTDIPCEERQEYEDGGCTGSITKPENIHKCNSRYGIHDGKKFICKQEGNECVKGDECENQPDIIVDTSCGGRTEYTDGGCNGHINSSRQKAAEKCENRYGIYEGKKIKCKLIDGVCDFGDEVCGTDTVDCPKVDCPEVDCPEVVPPNKDEQKWLQKLSIVGV